MNGLLPDKDCRLQPRKISRSPHDAQFLITCVLVSVLKTCFSSQFFLTLIFIVGTVIGKPLTKAKRFAPQEVYAEMMRFRESEAFVMPVYSGTRPYLLKMTPDEYEYHFAKRRMQERDRKHKVKALEAAGGMIVFC